MILHMLEPWHSSHLAIQHITLLFGVDESWFNNRLPAIVTYVMTTLGWSILIVLYA